MPVQTTAKNGIRDNSYYVNWRERIEGLEDLLVTRPDYRWNPEDKPRCATVPESWTKPAPEGAGRTAQEWFDQWYPEIQPGCDEPVRAIHECRGCPFQVQCLHEAVWHHDTGVRAGVSAKALGTIRTHLGIGIERNSVTPMLNEVSQALRKQRQANARKWHAQQRLAEAWGNRVRDENGKYLPGNHGKVPQQRESEEPAA